jgi:hypothetical protein
LGAGCVIGVLEDWAIAAVLISAAIAAAEASRIIMGELRLPGSKLNRCSTTIRKLVHMFQFPRRKDSQPEGAAFGNAQ